MTDETYFLNKLITLCKPIPIVSDLKYWNVKCLFFMKKYPVRCPISSYQYIMDGHWKPMIVSFVRSGSLRFKDLRERLPDISTKVLSEQLAELEADKIITRRSYKEVPPRVEYSLSDYGKTLIPVLDTIKAWGYNYLRENPKILHKDSEWRNKLNKPPVKFRESSKR